MEGRKGTLFTVFSTAYAVGKTLLAINIAAELARQGLKVCLVDLDLQFGDVCYYLKLNPERTIADAQKSMEKNPKDTVAVEYLTRYQEGNTGFDVLANPKLLEEAYNMDNNIIKSLVLQLQLEYDYVILDTTSTFSALNLSIMDLSTLINFVGIVDFIPTIKNMKRGSDTLKELGYDDSKIRYVLNRNNAKTRIDVEDVESIRTGVPCILGSRHTLLAQGMASMVDGYVHPENEARDSRGDNSGGGWLSRIFS